MGTTSYSLVPISVRGQEASALYFMPAYTAFSDSEMGQLFTIDTTIPVNGQKQTLFVGNMNAPMRIKTGCGSNPTGSMSIGGKMLAVKKVESFIPNCLDDFERSALQQLNGKPITSLDYNMQQTLLMSIANKRLMEGEQRQRVNNAFFGSLASTDATMNLCDGLFSVLLPQAIGNGTPNVDAFGGGALGAGDAVEYLNQIIEAQTNELLGVMDTDKWLIVSRAVQNALVRDLQAGAIGSGMYSPVIINGIPVPAFRGIPIKMVATLDSEWKALNGQSNGNLVLLTAKGNLQMGSSGAGAQMFEQWYDQKDQTNYSRTTDQFGFGIYSEELMVAGFKKP